MLTIEEVFKMVTNGNMTLEDFEDWVSEQQDTAFTNGVHAGQYYD
jgi:hypothetical protein